MREIKFRAWNYYDEKMCKVVDLDFKNKSALLYSKNNTDDPVDEVRFSFEDIELMQFTGLKDINENEIYVGDIVKITRTWEDGTPFQRPYNTPYKAIVEFGFSCYGLEVLKEDVIELFQGGEGIKYEVIGNIYENPEILEKNNE